MTRLGFNLFLSALLNASVGCAKNVEEPTARASASAPSSDKRVQLTIKAEALIVKSGEAVQLHLTVNNNTDHIVKILESTPDRDFWLSAKDNTHERVPLTRLGLHYESRDKWSYTGRQFIPLEPGAKREYRILVNRFYDMSLAGTYFISARFFIGRDPNNPFGEQLPIESNEIAIEISSF